MCNDMCLCSEHKELEMLNPEHHTGKVHILCWHIESLHLKGICLNKQQF